MKITFICAFFAHFSWKVWMLNKFAEHSCQVNKKTMASENLSSALSRGPRRLLCVLICVFWPFLGGYNSFLPEHQTVDSGHERTVENIRWKMHWSASDSGRPPAHGQTTFLAHLVLNKCPPYECGFGKSSRSLRCDFISRIIPLKKDCRWAVGTQAWSVVGQ